MSAVPDVFAGRVAWIFGEDFDVDLVIGVKNIKYYDPEVLHAACMKAFDANWVNEVRAGDIVVGGRNFGYGHPHYPAMLALRNEGVTAVVAESFSPGFWRGETYNGVPLITIPGVSAFVAQWDDVEVDWRNAVITKTATGEQLAGQRPSDRAIKVIEAGGSLNLLKAEHSRIPVS
jgi:3-isopropylmalate/(R)-2-methylmalate dehydratase small subunit